jgi:hypothetical protein
VLEGKREENAGQINAGIHRREAEIKRDTGTENIHGERKNDTDRKKTRGKNIQIDLKEKTFRGISRQHSKIDKQTLKRERKVTQTEIK